MKALRSILLCIVSLAFVTACDSEKKKLPEDSATAKIFVSNYPLAYFAERISGDPEQVYFPKIDGDPAFWTPTPGDITKIQQSNPIILNGAGYEKWQKTSTLPEHRIIDSSASFKDQLISIKKAISHQHGPEGPHSHSGTVFTTWIDFSQAIQQAQKISEGLTAAKISTAEDLQLNLKSLTEDLSTLDQQLKKMTSAKPGLTLIASHPIYQYFARAYQLDIHSMLWEPDVYPDESQWQALEKTLAEHPAKWMIWEGPPLDKSVQRLKKMGLRSVVFSPCANTPDSGDFLTVMKQNIENLRPVFQP